MGAVPGKILVVDDEPQSCSAISCYLAAHGLDCQTTLDPRLVEELLAGQQFDVLIADIAMPRPGGLEAARALKADPRTKDIPIWAITAHARTEDRNKALAAGCDGYIAKPSERWELVRQLRELVTSLAKVR